MQTLLHPSLACNALGIKCLCLKDWRHHHILLVLLLPPQCFNTEELRNPSREGAGIRFPLLQPCSVAGGEQGGQCPRCCASSHPHTYLIPPFLLVVD